MIQSTQLIQLKLEEPFPKEAHSSDLSRGSKSALTSVKAQYIIERLNKIFGFSGWHFKETFIEKEQGVLCRGILVLGDSIREVESVGFSDWSTKKAVWKDGKRVPGQFEMVPRNVGDVYKSSSTDALGKAASKLGIANDVFKGMVSMDNIDLTLRSCYIRHIMRVHDLFGTLDMEKMEEVKKLSYAECIVHLRMLMNKEEK